MSVFAILAEPNRRLILDELRSSPQTVNALVDSVGISQPAVSKHLRILREADLVAVRRDGQHRWYQLEPAALKELADWLEPFRQMWADRLDQLEEHLDHDPGPNNKEAS